MKLLIALLFLYGTHVNCHEETNEEKKDICLSKDCIAASHRIFENINDQVDPCEDFNEFACGNFIANTLIPDDKSRYNTFDIIGDKIDIQGRQLLESPIDKDDDFESEIMAKTFYQSCMDVDFQEEQGLKPMRDLLDKIGGWPVIEGDKWSSADKDVWSQQIEMFHLGFSSDYIVEVSIYADSKNNTHRVLYLDQASLGLSKEYWDKGRQEPEVKAYAQYMIDTAVLFGADFQTASQEMEKVMEFEMKLANISAPKEARRNKTKLYNPTTLGKE